MSLAWPELVVDASVGVKWYLPEVHSAESHQLPRPGVRLHVPALFFTEVTQTTWKRAHLRREIGPARSRRILAELLRSPLDAQAVDPLLGSPLGLALETGRTVHDFDSLVWAGDIENDLAEHA